MAPEKRMKAADRRRLILDAAIEEYGRSGMHEVSTEAIAERAGVSQPYLFRLFGTKAGLITAAITQHTDALRERFREAAENRAPDQSPLEAMGTAYILLMEEDPNSMRCQLHTWGAASDPEIGPVARETYREIWRDIAELSGATADEVRDFMAQGMLLTVVAALDLTEMYGDPLAVVKEF
jgi:AcrR family transcriptional regulator